MAQARGKPRGAAGELAQRHEPEIVERVIAGPGGLAETALAGTVVIDLSTNSPETAQAMAAAPTPTESGDAAHG